MEEIGLYIHFPFCEQKCKYCDFCSFAGVDNLQKDYVKKLLQEIEFYGKTAKDKIIKTIFLGGGTPSVMFDGAIKMVMDKIENMFNCGENVEISIECNPNSLTEKKLNEYLSAKINRISMGVQSLDSNVLLSIGRGHNREQALKSMELLDKYNCNYSIDLMCGLPLQTPEIFQNTINEILNFNFKHLSCYSLILEEKTELYRLVQNKKIVLPKEEDTLKMYDYCASELGKKDFMQYEVSNFAKNGFECKHNINYWKCGSYLGLGVSAHSYMDNYRFSNTNNLREYLRQEKFGKENAFFCEKIDLETQKIEFLMLGLRMNKGISLNEYKSKFGSDLEIEKYNEIKKLKANGFIKIEDSRLYVPTKAMRILNQIILELI